MSLIQVATLRQPHNCSSRRTALPIIKRNLSRFKIRDRSQYRVFGQLGNFHFGYAIAEPRSNNFHGAYNEWASAERHRFRQEQKQ